MAARTSRRGFSQVELLVVIAIIGILVALIIPAVQQAREAANRAQCRNNLYQIGLALHHYHVVNNHFPMGAWNGLPFYDSLLTSNVRGGTWWLEILPYLDETPLHSALLHDKRGTFGGSGSNNPKNAGLFVKRGPISAMLCPSSPAPQVTQPWHTTGQAPLNTNAGFVGLCIPSYVGISGGDMGYYEGDDLRFKTLKPEVVFNTAFGSVATDGVLVPCRTVAYKDILDGTSNTIAVGEQSDYFKGKEECYPSSDVVGGFFGTGIGGFFDDGKQIRFEAPQPSRWQSAAYLQTTSSALTTVRWPLNFKSMGRNAKIGRCYQWDFSKKNWNSCQAAAACGGHFSGLLSWEFFKIVNCESYWGVGGNIPIQSAHPGGAMVLFADGHVSFLSDGLAAKGLVGLAGRGSVLERLCVRDDRQLVEIPD